MEPGLSGYTMTRNCIELDYCFRECISSLLPICDEVVVNDSCSTDGTLEELREWASREPKLRIVQWEWPNPVDDKLWFLDWINTTRLQLDYNMQLCLDADEVLHESSHNEIRRAVMLRECRWFSRHNFWKDHKHLAPSGHACGDAVVRLGPSELFMCSDEPHPEGEPEIRRKAKQHPRLQIFHYGFIRKTAAFLEKSKRVQHAFFGGCDDRLVRCAETGEDWVEACPFPLPLQNFSGSHPEVAKAWLRERGYDC